VESIERFSTASWRIGETTHIEVHGELDCSTVPTLEGRVDTVLHAPVEREFELTGMRRYVPRTARR
jgi:hypothetical protein